MLDIEFVFNFEYWYDFDACWRKVLSSLKSYRSNSYSNSHNNCQELSGLTLIAMLRICLTLVVSQTADKEGWVQFKSPTTKLSPCESILSKTLESSSFTLNIIEPKSAKSKQKWAGLDFIWSGGWLRKVDVEMSGYSPVTALLLVLFSGWFL